MFSDSKFDYSSEESLLLGSYSRRRVRIKSAEEEFDDFDDVLEHVGSEGRFQKILLYCILCPIAIAEPFFTMNMFFMLYVPNHWCHVPGQGNETEEEWKNATIPMEDGPDGYGFSQCKMYGENGEPVSCQFGWDYDRTYYGSTIATDFNWICSEAYKVTQVFTASNVGNAVGTIVLGHVSDKIGRKPIVFLSLVITLVFGVGSLFLPSVFPAFLAINFLSGLAYPSLITALCLIASETCSVNYRSWVFSLLCFCRVAGNTIFPVIAWALSSSWFLIGVASYIPILLILPMWPFFPESIRWLLAPGEHSWLVSRERNDAAVSLLTRVAKLNKKDIRSTNLKRAVERIQEMNDGTNNGTTMTTQGAWTLFSRRRLGLHTFLLCSTWAIIGLIFYGLNLNSLNMNGNPFINHIVLVGLVDLPAGWVLQMLTENFGRRWTQTVLLLFAATSTVVAALLIASGTYLEVIICGLVAKFFIVICDLITDLQGNELFPTQLRSTGFSLAASLSAFISILAPSLVFMGKSYAAGPYIILSCLSVSAAILASFIPETVNRKLPESIEEANDLGRFDKYFSYLPKY